jgi:hypothetical protein|uniref:Purple acid phosphatase n=1 Tax=Globisporangium ultimum (strain ATCC 200006 / CBS 805.95 / DAOM BR144) TaxID=431595 RepID=K3WNF5_GLOUD
MKLLAITRSVVLLALALTASIVTLHTASAAVDTHKVPQQIHLAFAGAKTGAGMTVSWATTDDVVDSAVWIGTSLETLTKATTNVSSKSYYADNGYSLFHHHATVSGLTPHTKYYYKVGSLASTELQSQVNTFTTARNAQDTAEFEIAIYGDGGDGENSVDTIKYVNGLAGKVDFIYHIGDISYADDDFLRQGKLLDFGYEEIWNNWTNSLAPVMNTMPYMVVVGNHEAECHSPACSDSNYRLNSLGNYTAYNTRFKMPSVESGGALNMWHSFNHGPIHFTSVSTESDFVNAPTNQFTNRVKNGNFGDQLEWLEADLEVAAKNRADVPWLIVGMHRPMYHAGDADTTGNPKKGTQPQYIQAAFEELFIKYGVDVVLAGHEHSYERHVPIARGKPVMTGVSADKKTYVNPQAPVHIITGAAGNAEGHTEEPDAPAAWSAVFDYEHYGISKVKVSLTKLEWSFVASADGSVLDNFVMTKERASC